MTSLVFLLQKYFKIVQKNIHGTEQEQCIGIQACWEYLQTWTANHAILFYTLTIYNKHVSAKVCIIQHITTYYTENPLVTIVADFFGNYSTLLSMWQKSLKYDVTNYILVLKRQTAWFTSQEASNSTSSAVRLVRTLHNLQGKKILGQMSSVALAIRL